MSGDYSNLEFTLNLEKEDKMNGRYLNTMKRTGAIVLSLGLLSFILLIVTLGLVAHNFTAISNWSQVSQHEFKNLTSQWAELKMKLNNLTKTVKTQEKSLCTVGWIEMNRKCYYISPKGVSKSWHNSGQDCEDRGGRLATIETPSELKVLSLFHERAWIGLTDIAGEGRWVWADGTKLSVSDFWMPGEPNNADGGEDCAHINRMDSKVGLNDNKCNVELSFICEHKV